MNPKIKVDFEQVEKLCVLQCTGEEIASFLGIDYDTLNARVKEKYKISTSEYIKRNGAKGKASLRRSQWKSAIEDGNVTMQIWLGKNMLGQRDRSEIENIGSEVKKIEVEIVDPKT